MGTTSPTHIYTAATTATADEPRCYRIDDAGIIWVECEYGVAYSTSATARITTSSSAASKMRTTVLPKTNSTSTSFTSSLPISSARSNSTLRASSSASVATNATNTGPTVITTEGGVWISGSYEGMYASGSSAVLASAGTGNGTVVGKDDGGHGGRPSPLPIILSCVFGALFFACATALGVLWHRRRRARRLGLSSPPLRSDKRLSGMSGRVRGLFAQDRRHSLAGSGRFSLFAPEEIDGPLSASPDGTDPAAALSASTTLLGRSMTTTEKQALLREASSAERRAAADAIDDDELALVRRKLDGWAAHAAQARRGEVVRPLEGSSPFDDRNAVPGLQAPRGVRLPLTITTALPATRGAQQPPLLPPPLLPAAASSSSDAGSLFSYSHTPTDLYPGPSAAAGAHAPASPWSPDSAGSPSASSVVSPDSGATATSASHAPLLPPPRGSSSSAPTTTSSTAGARGPPERRQETDAGHLAGLQRFTLRDEQFAPGADEDGVEPPAYRW